MRLHKQNYNYKHQGKTLQDVTAEVVAKLAKKKLENEIVFPLVKDNGRLIFAFDNQDTFLQFIDLIEEQEINEYGDEWHQVGDTLRFEEIVVAEFWTTEKYEVEEERFWNDFESDLIKKDTGRYTIWDVYSKSELL